MGVLPLKSGSYNAEQGRGGMPMDDILQVNERLRGLIWGAPMLILLLGTGLYFTAVTGVFQVRYCALWLRKTLFSCFLDIWLESVVLIRLITPKRNTSHESTSILPNAT